MKLRARLFERGVRRQVKAALRASPPLWSDFRQLKRRRRQSRGIPAWLGRVFFAVWIGFMLGGRYRPIEIIGSIIALWTVGMMFFRAAQFRTALYLSPALAVYKLLPIGDQDIFRVQWQAFLRSSLWSATEFTVAYSLITWRVLDGYHFALAGLAFGLAQTLCITVAAVCLYAFVRPSVYRLAPLFFGSAIAMAIFGASHLNLARGVMQCANWLPPVGWIFHVLGVAPGQTMTASVVPITLVAVLLALFPIAWKRARDFYVPTEELFVAAERAASRNPVPTLQGVAEQLKQDPAESELAIRARHFLQIMDWRTLGPVERAVARILTPRERLVAEFMLAGNPQWTKGLRQLVIFLASGLGLLFLLGWLTAAGPFLAVSVLAVIFLSTQASWRGFGMPRGSGLQSPFYSLYPISFRELMSTVVKVNITRFLIVFPLVVLALAFAANALRLKSSFTVLALKLLLLGIALQPFAALLPLSGGSNDSQRGGFAALALIIALSTVGCGVTFFIAQSLLVILVSGAMTCALSFGSLWFYGSLFNRNRFDLIPIRTDALNKQ